MLLLCLLYPDTVDWGGFVVAVFMGEQVGVFLVEGGAGEFLEWKDGN